MGAVISAAAGAALGFVVAPAVMEQQVLYAVIGGGVGYAVGVFLLPSIGDTLSDVGDGAESFIGSLFGGVVDGFGQVADAEVSNSKKLANGLVDVADIIVTGGINEAGKIGGALLSGAGAIASGVSDAVESEKGQAVIHDAEDLLGKGVSAVGRVANSKPVHDAEAFIGKEARVAGGFIGKEANAVGKWLGGLF